MTLLLFDGFEATAHILTSKYTAANNAQIQTAQFRTGTRSISRAGSATSFSLFKQVAGADEHATFIIGGGIFQNSNTNYAAFQFRSDATATIHVEVRFNMTNRRVEVYRGAGTTLLAQSADNVFPYGSWFFAEAKCTLGDGTAGSVEVRLNGASTALAMSASLTGIDTKNAGTKTVFDGAIWWSAGSGVHFDDVYACNGAGSAPYNDFLGEIKVDTLVPNAAGDVTQFTPSSAVANWTTVDEVPAVTTDYNYSDVMNAYDLYNLSGLSGSGTPTILAVQTHIYAAKADAGNRSAADMLKTGGTAYTGADKQLSTGVNDFFVIYPLNPVTGVAWTAAEIAALQAGMKVR